MKLNSNSYGLRSVFVFLSLLSLIVAGIFMFAVYRMISGLYMSNAMVSLDDAMRMAVFFSIFSMWLMFGCLFIALHLRFIEPFTNLTTMLRSITESRDWGRRLIIPTKIREMNSLIDDFNRLLLAAENDNDKLREMSMRDPLTGLLNRRGFEEHLYDELERARRFQSKFSIILVDMDKFKSINDTHGHPAGDMVLKGFSDRIRQLLRTVDSFARVGGDEFLIILPSADAVAGLAVANKLHAAINSAPFVASHDGNVLLTVTASIGVASYPDNGTDSNSLHQAVDEVLYKAKDAGKNCVVSLMDSTRSAFGHASKLKQAIDNGQVEVVFQPIVMVGSGKLCAYEVLARIKENDVLHSAAHFIETAEKAGLAKDIDTCVFEKGLASLYQRNDESVKMFFNFSCATLSDEKWMLGVPDMIKAAGVECNRVVIEITEREMLPRIDELKRIIGKLKECGVMFALDDFGSGFSSFFYVQQFQVDYLKIDGGFVRNLANSPNDRAIVENIQRLANKFGLTTIAEFVEDDETAKILGEIGVHSAQGYHFGKPCLHFDFGRPKPVLA